MTTSEIQELRDELTALKAERTRRFSKGRVVSANNGTESVTRTFGSSESLETRIRQLERELAFATGSWGALHTR